MPKSSIKLLEAMWKDVTLAMPASSGAMSGRHTHSFPVTMGARVRGLARLARNCHEGLMRISIEQLPAWFTWVALKMGPPRWFLAAHSWAVIRVAPPCAAGPSGTQALARRRRRRPALPSGRPARTARGLRPDAPLAGVSPERLQLRLDGSAHVHEVVGLVRVESRIR